MKTENSPPRKGHTGGEPLAHRLSLQKLRGGQEDLFYIHTTQVGGAQKLISAATANNTKLWWGPTLLKKKRGRPLGPPSNLTLRPRDAGETPPPDHTPFDEQRSKRRRSPAQQSSSTHNTEKKFVDRHASPYTREDNRARPPPANTTPAPATPAGGDPHKKTLSSPQRTLPQREGPPPRG